MSAFHSQLKRHLDALRASGVEYVPRAAAPPADFGTTIAEPAAEPRADESAQRVALQTLAAEVAKCEECPSLFSTRSHTVFGSGSPQPELVLIGDAPNSDDDRDGQPFRGEVGDLLDRMLTGGMKLTRDDVYLLNLVKCRPPGQRLPSADECRNCRGYLDRQLAILRPRFILCLGELAARALLDTSAGLRTLRGLDQQYHGATVVCTHHPAAMLKQDGLKREAWADILRLLALMGRDPTGVKR